MTCSLLLCYKIYFEFASEIMILLVSIYKLINKISSCNNLIRCQVVGVELWNCKICKKVLIKLSKEKDSSQLDPS
jgi:hypothetical protein